MIERACKTCGEIKPLVKNRSVCAECLKIERKVADKKYEEKNKDIILKKGRDKYSENIEYERERSKKYRENNKEKIKQKRNERNQIKRLEDPSFKLKTNISRRIRKVLKDNNSSKNNNPCFISIGYSPSTLKLHLESLFENWMSWKNYGIYDKNIWNDDNVSTWTWNIDHIIPQSDLPYSSMEDENFKKCWALDNLRPLSAKENFLLGIEINKQRMKRNK